MTVASGDLQYRLARDELFLRRVESRMVFFALYVKENASKGGANRTAWCALADKVRDNSAAQAQRMAMMLVGSANVRETIVNNDNGTVTTTVIETALDGQIESLWDDLARDGSLV